MSLSDSSTIAVECVKDLENKTINIKLPLSKENQLKVEKFINEFKIETPKQFIKNWFFDEKNYLIIGPEEKYQLTKKEMTFVRLLLTKRVITYEEMISLIWETQTDISKNAIVCFVKNFKKKLPSAILKNINNIGYYLSI